MREARIDDYWRKVSSRKYPTQMKRFTFSNIAGLGSGDITFSGGINAICGPNGSGKSTLLSCIHCALNLSYPCQDFTFRASSACSCDSWSVILDVNGREYILTHTEGINTRTGELPEALRVASLEPSRESPYLLHQFRTTDNLEEQLETVEPSISGNEERGILTYLVGKDYSSIKIYELEDSYDMPLVPFFEVSVKDVFYDSR